MWDLSSVTRNQTQLLALEMLSLNHWMAGEVPTRATKEAPKIISRNSLPGSQKDLNSLYSHQPEWKTQIWDPK